MKKIYGIGILILVMMLLTGIRHQDWLSAPTRQYMGDTHDGFRSFLASEYHVRYDSTYSWYQGMNYPYGDRTVFSGCQPLFSNGVKFIHENITEMPEGGPLIIQFMILISLVLSGLFLYLLFQKLKLPVAYSIAVAVGITFLSPQLDRFHAHYGLSYTFVIPLCLYLLYLFEEQKKWKWSLITGLFLFLLTWIHLYLFALTFFTISFFFFFRVLSNLSWETLKTYSMHWAVQCLMPAVLAQLWVWYADPITDRSALPYGFKVYIAHWQTVLFSPVTELGREMIQDYPVKPFVTPEAYAWVGSSVIGLAVMSAGLWLWKKIKKEKIEWGTSEDRSFLLSLGAAAFLLLLISFGIPFIYRAFNGLEYHLGPLIQFRSLGRFAWIFVYVSNVVLFYWLYQCYERMQYKKLGIVLLLAALGLLNYDAYRLAHAKKISQKVYPVPADRKGFRVVDNPWLKEIDADRYQAILPLPYYHIGSENIWMQVKGKYLHHSLSVSLETGLPLMGVFMARTSLSQTLNQIEFIGEAYRVPRIIEDMPNEKPILIYLKKFDYEPVWYRYNHLLYGLKPFYEDKEVQLFELPIATVRERVEKKRQEFLAEKDTLTLFDQGEILSKDSLPDYVYRSFDDLKSEKTYHAGACEVIGREGFTLFEGQIPAQRAKDRYVFSLWSFAQEDLHMKTWVHLIEKDAAGKELQTLHFELNKYIRSVDEGWVLADVPFRLKSADSQLKILVDNQDLRNQPFYIDELQIRLQDAVLFREDGGEFARNNRWFEK